MSLGRESGGMDCGTRHRISLASETFCVFPSAFNELGPVNGVNTPFRGNVPGAALCKKDTDVGEEDFCRDPVFKLKR